MVKPALTQLIEAGEKKTGKSAFQGTLVAVDPGETIGYAIFQHGKVVACGEHKCDNFTQACEFIDELGLYNFSNEPTNLVIENYQVYSWRAKEHSWSTMFTSRVIGAIELQCWFLDWPIWKQTAQNAKKFMTDERLKEWGMWEKGKRHARDAIRHG